jgi:hypothetical protein
MQTDPKGYDAGTLNLYGYVHDDPVDKVDPTGLEGFCIGVCRVDQGPNVVVGIESTGIYINPTAPHAGLVFGIASLFIPGVGEGQRLQRLSQRQKAKEPLQTRRRPQVVQRRFMVRLAITLLRAAAPPLFSKPLEVGSSQGADETLHRHSALP